MASKNKTSKPKRDFGNGKQGKGGSAKQSHACAAGILRAATNAVLAPQHKEHIKPGVSAMSVLPIRLRAPWA